MGAIQTMQNIIEEEEQPLVIELPKGNRRVIAEIFEHPDGVVFVDVGFCDPTVSFHPYHVVDGKVSGSNPWRVGGARIKVIDNTDDLYENWQNWIIARRATEGCTRDLALRNAREEFDF